MLCAGPEVGAAAANHLSPAVYIHGVGPGAVRRLDDERFLAAVEEETVEETSLGARSPVARRSGTRHPAVRSDVVDDAVIRVPGRHLGLAAGRHDETLSGDVAALAGSGIADKRFHVRTARDEPKVVHTLRRRVERPRDADVAKRSAAPHEGHEGGVAAGTDLVPPGDLAPVVEVHGVQAVRIRLSSRPGGVRMAAAEMSGNVVAGSSQSSGAGLANGQGCARTRPRRRTRARHGETSFSASFEGWLPGNTLGSLRLVVKDATLNAAMATGPTRTRR